MKTTAAAVGWLAAAMAATVARPCDGAVRGGPQSPRRDGRASEEDWRLDRDAEEEEDDEEGEAEDDERRLQGGNIFIEPYGPWLGPTYSSFRPPGSIAEGVAISNGRLILGVSKFGTLYVAPNRDEAPPITRAIGLRRLIPDDEIAAGNLGDVVGPRDDTPSQQIEIFTLAAPCEGWGLSVDGESLDTGATNVYFSRCGGRTECDSRFRETFCIYGEVAPDDDPDWRGGDSVYSARPFVNASVAVIMLNSTDKDDPYTREKLLITRDYHPSDATDDIYVTDVTLTNLWDQNITHVKYRATADFDVFPTKFKECMTMQPDPSLVQYWENGTNDGFQTSNPLAPLQDRTGIAPLKDYVMPDPGDIAPDQGSAFDFTFPDIPVGGSFQFQYFYGAFENVAEAEIQMVRAGVEMYAMGMPRSADGQGCADGPNIFIAGFSNVGGEAISHSPSMMPSVSSSPSVSTIPTASFSPSQTPSISSSPSATTAPTSQPSATPSASTMPSSNPSHNPSVSSQPSISQPPSAQPSANPTSSHWPTSQPSESPSLSSKPSSSRKPSISAAPSTSMIPSSLSSHVPSVSSQPSPGPSVTPSVNPSVAPAAEPSALPSTAPTPSPSEHPSISTAPSVSSAPSSSQHPSISIKPTVSLRPSLSIPLFYPDLTPESEGCLSDGNEEKYMKDNPDSYIFETADECCEKFFKWDIQNCRKNALLEPCVWYPNFENGVCRNDCREPLLIKRFEEYRFDTAEECCDSYFPWSREACLNPEVEGDPCADENVFNLYYNQDGYNEDFLKSLEYAYYPVFDQDDVYCLRDGESPAYMNAHPTAWKHETLAQCCWMNFQSELRECIGDILGGDGNNTALSPCVEPPPPLSGRWYVEYYNPDDFHCVKECNGPFPCNGRANSYKGKGVTQDYELYATFNICCEAHTWWKFDCDAYDENGVYIEIDSTSGDWYVDYEVDDDPVCLRECDGPEPCNGRAPTHKETYKTFRECCELHLWYFVECTSYDEQG